MSVLITKLSSSYSRLNILVAALTTLISSHTLVLSYSIHLSLPLFLYDWDLLIMASYAWISPSILACINGYICAAVLP